jgi:hypothetical protein
LWGIKWVFAAIQVHHQFTKMRSAISIVALLSALVVAAQSNSSVIAVFLLGRHGERTPKLTGSTELTTLGRNQVFNAGSFVRNLYLDSSSPDFITGVNLDYVPNQIFASVPYVQVLEVI